MENYEPSILNNNSEEINELCLKCTDSNFKNARNELLLKKKILLLEKKVSIYQNIIKSKNKRILRNSKKKIIGKTKYYIKKNSK